MIDIDLSKYREQYNTDSGHAFEYYCADVLRNYGYINVNVTVGSGDYGVDILAEKDGLKWAIQCKYYNSHIGIKSIQEVYTGCSYYECDKAMVMTNTDFTKDAINLANKLDVCLFDFSNKIDTSNIDIKPIDFNYIWGRLNDFYTALLNIRSKHGSSIPVDKQEDNLLNNYDIKNCIDKNVTLDCCLLRYNDGRYRSEIAKSYNPKFVKYKGYTLEHKTLEGILKYENGVLYLLSANTYFRLCNDYVINYIDYADNFAKNESSSITARNLIIIFFVLFIILYIILS